ncbi:MAG TPA: ImmA/IrrE family metallo-endopeptidase [Blastocatellia bacterium]
MWRLDNYLPHIKQAYSQIPKDLIGELSAHGWNTQMQVESDLPVIYNRYGITPVTADMPWPGACAIRPLGKVVFLQTGLKAPFKTFVALHEVNHLLAHRDLLMFCDHPDSDPIKECQANILAAVAMLPAVITRGMPWEDIVAVFRMPQDVYSFRIRILTECGV